MGFYFSNKVDSDLPYYKVTVTSESGLLAFGEPWKRGSQIFIQADSDKYEETKDREGNSWLDKPSTEYEVKFLDPLKDAKLKETLVLVDHSSESVIESKQPNSRTKKSAPKE